MGEHIQTFDGVWEDEIQATESLKAALRVSQLFKIIPEAQGFWLYPRPGSTKRHLRPDVLACPTPLAMEIGWTLGFIAFEVKAPGLRIGPAVSQAGDYTACVFRLTGERMVHASWSFLFPLSSVFGDVASIMAQARIGNATLDHQGNITLKTNGTNILSMSPEGWRFREPLCGRKAGHRGR